MSDKQEIVCPECGLTTIEEADDKDEEDYFCYACGILWNNHEVLKE